MRELIKQIKDFCCDNKGKTDIDFSQIRNPKSSHKAYAPKKSINNFKGKIESRYNLLKKNN
jgi:hypothetical protein|tara:strand:+ start:468 stop:650 length:183 start_codon:yes stop_codon:yes gene_type:complete